MAHDKFEKYNLTEKRFVTLLGIQLINSTVDELVDLIVRCALDQVRLTLSFVNPHSFIMARKNPRFMEELNALDLVGADGIGVVWASKILLQQPLLGRLSADLLAPGLLSRMEEHGLKLFLFGSHEGMARKAAHNISRRFPELRIVGTHHGYIQGHQENSRLIEYINETGADIVWVGLGAPLQERWIVDNAHFLEASVLMTCGGLIHQAAAQFPYYPEWAYRYRLNWLYRLCKEPTRLWRRYTLEIAQFGIMVIDAKLKAKLAK